MTLKRKAWSLNGASRRRIEFYIKWNYHHSEAQRGELSLCGFWFSRFASFAGADGAGINSKHTRDYAAARALWVRLVDRLIAEDDAPDEAAQFEASEREVMRKAIANFENGGTDGQCG